MFYSTFALLPYTYGIGMECQPVQSAYRLLLTLPWSLAGAWFGPPTKEN